MAALFRNSKYLYLFCITAFFLVGCENQVPKEEEPVPVEAPKQVIPLAQAKQLYDTYTERRVPIIKEYEAANGDSTEFTPTRLGEYDYETLKRYLAYIEYEAKTAGVEISKMRFYFVNYPDAKKFDDGSPVPFPKQNTFFLVPTMKKDGNDYAFLTDDDANGNRVAVLVKDRVGRLGGEQRVPGKIGKTAGWSGGMLSINPSFQDEGEGEHSLILNESHVIPPPPDAETDFDD
ncbi:MAG: hypothetical protein CMC08_07395 [Flavobacteriaceae bacterium]|mgnify:CR=1 FL=1|nr:hypothetical protein [Flavobacteriaceae bacterium]